MQTFQALLQVTVKPGCRVISTAEKLQHLEAYGQANQTQQGGDYCRAAGLHSSRITQWRKQRDAGMFDDKQRDRSLDNPSQRTRRLRPINSPKSPVGTRFGNHAGGIGHYRESARGLGAALERTD